MANRRNFLKHAGAFALGTLLLPACNTARVTNQAGGDTSGSTNTVGVGSTGTAATGNLGTLGLQLYSVKDIIEQDVPGTLRKLAAMGYKEIESYPGSKGHYFGYEPKDFKKMTNDLGLNLVSSHFGSGSRSGQAGSWRQATMLQNFEELTQKAAETGQQYITCSWMDESLRKTPDDIKRTADLFNQTGETAKKAGLQFAYHNHDFEFKQVGDTMIYDYMLDNTDADLVKYELDLFWVVAAGRSPLAYFRKYPNRFPLGHVKDMDKQNPKNNTEIGTGSINYQEIVKAAKAAGMKHYLVEQETFTRPSIESMQLNYTNLSKLSV